MPDPSNPLDQIDLENPLFYALPVGILILDDSGHVRFANPVAEGMLGVKAANMGDRLALRAALDVARRDLRQAPAHNLDLDPTQVAHQKSPHKTIEITLARPDGTPVWLNLRTNPIPGGFVIALESAGPRIHDSAALEAHTRLVEQAHTLELEDLLRASLDEVQKLTFSSSAGYLLIDEGQTAIVMQVSSTRTDAQALFGDRQQVPRSLDVACIAEEVLRRQTPTMHNDESAMSATDGYYSSGYELVVPVVRDGKVRAIVVVRNKPFHYDEADVRVVERLANLSWELASLKLARRDAERRADLITKVAASVPGLLCEVRLRPDGRLSLHHLAAADEDFFGIPAAELATDVSGFQALIHPDDIGHQRVQIAASARDLTPYHNRSRIHHPTKGLRWIEAWTTPQREPDGGTVWHGILMDVTAQAEAEAASAKNAARVEESFNQAAIGLVLTGPDLKVIRANQAFCTMLGYSQEELAATDILAFTHPEDRDPTVRVRQELLHGGPRSFEKRYLHKDGRVIWAQVDYSAVNGDDGHLSHFFSQVQDITKRKHADQERDLTLKILAILNRTDDVAATAKQILSAIRTALNIEAGAIRLTQDGNYAYVAHEGFPDEFVRSERCLHQPSADDPSPAFDGVCSRVMEGRTELGEVAFTPAGSACIDNSPAVLSIPAAREYRQNPLNRCFHFGYQSVLVIPVHSGDQIVAMLQLNDRRPHAFTPEQISFLEGLAPTIGLALERKQTAERFAQAQRQLELTSQAAGAGYWRYNPQTKSTEWSPALWALLGHGPGQLDPSINTWLTVVHPEDLALVQEVIRRLDDSGDDVDFEWRAVHPDGKVRWLLSRCRSEKLAERQHAYAGITIDITERKAMEEALRASEERFSRAFHLAPVLALMVRAVDNTILDANREFCRATQFTSQELVGHSLVALGMVADVENAKGGEQMAREGQLRNVETVLRTKGGQSLECLLSVQPFELHGERLLLAMATDVTESKRAQAALRENEERFRLLIEHAPTALALFDNDMCYLAASRRWMDDYGLGDRDIVGKSHYEIFPDLPEALKTVHRLALAGETIRASEDRFERQDGSVHLLRWEVLPWHRADGSIGGIVLFSEDVTARRVAEMESQAVRAKLDAALESTTDAVVISDAEGHFIDFNEAFATFHKFANKQECSRVFAEYPDFLEVYAPSGQPVPVYQWAVPRALRGETATNTEFGFRRKDTGETWVGSFSFAPIRDESQAIVGTVVVGRDITEQKRAEKALHEVSERFRQISDAAKDWIWEVDADGLYTYSSPVVEQLLGYRPDELVGRRHFYDLWPTEAREALLPEVLEKTRRKESFRNLPNTCLHKDGHPVLIESTGFPVLGPDGVLLGYRGADRDVTDRETAQTALRESEVRFRELFEQSPVALWEEDLSSVADRFSELRAEGITNLASYLDEHPEQVADLAGRVRILAVNESSLKLLGASSAQELLRDLTKYFTEASLAVFRQNMVNLFNGRTKFETETTHRDAQGKVLDLQLRMSVLPGHVHTLSRVLVSFIDLTARKAAEAERHELERQVNHLQRLESLGRLASGVSHDMNNVLGAIMAVGSLLQSKYKHDPAILKDAEMLLRAATRGRDLVQGLRDFSRKELQSARQLDLNDIIRHEADLLERTSLKRLSIVLDLAPCLPGVFGEASGIQTALMNLCVNAMDAMPDKGTLTLSSRDLGQGFVELAVADDGHGMPPEVLARALEPFFTTKPIGKGTGLGLSQVYGTVKAHGGSLDIKSAPGEGTRVTMVFPSMQVLAERTNPEHDPIGHPSRVLRVLLVDDEEMIRGSVLSLLDVLGHDAQAASSGIEALRRLDAGMEVDLVILDVNMPGMDGIETVVRLRMGHPDVKILFATGYADDRLPSILRRFPDIRILKKPFTITELRRVLSDWS